MPRMSMKYLVVLLVLVATPTMAQESPQYKTCIEMANDQMTLNMCAKKELGGVEGEMQGTEEALGKKTAGERKAEEKIKGEDRAWVACRDVFWEAVGQPRNKEVEYASTSPMESGEPNRRTTPLPSGSYF